MDLLEKNTCDIDINLNEEVNNKKEKLFQISKKIKDVESELNQLKKLHADEMQELCKIDIYNQRAKRHNLNNFFYWRKQSIGEENLLWEYESPTMRFKIKLKVRQELKLWRYEVHVIGTQVYFESYEMLPMYERERRNGWCWSNSNFLINIFDGESLSHKFKTYEEAIKKVEYWIENIELKLKEKLAIEKEFYLQATKKYNNTVRIELTYQSAESFFEEIKKYSLLVDKKEYYYVEISGENANQIIRKIKEKRHLEFDILAG